MEIGDDVGHDVVGELSVDDGSEVPDRCLGCTSGVIAYLNECGLPKTSARVAGTLRMARWFASWVGGGRNKSATN